jgi:hypothetical protein
MLQVHRRSQADGEHYAKSEAAGDGDEEDGVPIHFQ